MHSPICLVIILISLATLGSAITKTVGDAIYVVPSSALGILTAVRAELSSQVTQSAFAAALSKFPEAYGHNIPSDVASFLGAVLISSGIATEPAWMSAIQIDGVINQVLCGDLVTALNSVSQEVSTISGSIPWKNIENICFKTTILIVSVESSTAMPITSHTSTSATGSTFSSEASTTTKSLDSSTRASTTSATTTTTGSKASSTSTSTGGGHVNHPIGGLMIAGAAAAGVLGLSVMLT